MGIDQIVGAARRRYRQLSAVEANRECARGALIVDTRCADQRRSHGSIPGAIHVPLSVLPWRADPESGHDDPRISAADRLLILVCQDGYSSTLAVATLLDMGRDRVTDVAGGFVAWATAGLPVSRDPHGMGGSSAKRCEATKIRDVGELQTEGAQLL
jgi:rhodanese-related sulfurtransferase